MPGMPRQAASLHDVSQEGCLKPILCSGLAPCSGQGQGFGAATQGLDETPLTFVDTLDALRALAASLAGSREIAIDLEAHAHRSFQVRPLVLGSPEKGGRCHVLSWTTFECRSTASPVSPSCLLTVYV